MACQVVAEPQVRCTCGKEVLKNETSTMMNGGGVCPPVRAGFDSLRWTLQWRPKSRLSGAMARQGGSLHHGPGDAWRRTPA